MANSSRRCGGGLLRAALVGASLAAAVSSPAQTVPLEQNPILVERKVASGLLVTQVKPEYPALAKVNYIQGRVRMQVIVTPEGRVGEAHVVHGHPFLAASALRAVRRWVYRPFMTKSGPASFQTFVDMNFTLRSRQINQVPAKPERDLTRQIRPPEILNKPFGSTPTVSVRLRVLVSEKGQVIDSLPLAGLASHFDAARKKVGRWTFRPARWGALPVPWYLDVDVPEETLSLQEGASDPGGQ